MRRLLFFFSTVLITIFGSISYNYAETIIGSGTLNGGASEYHWTVAGSPYVIKDGSITIPESEPASFDEYGNLITFTDYNGNGFWDSSLTLTIDAGVVVKLYNSSINLSGNINLQSTAGNPVYFTSYKDDTVGGDTNGDGVDSTPAAGNWGYIQIDQNDGVDLHHCVIRYGGYSGSNHGAVYVYESSPTIRDNTIEYCEYGIEVFGDSNTSASSFAPSRPAVTNNTVQNCTYAPLLQVEYSFPSYSGNTFSGNGRQAVTVYGLLEASSPQVDTWDDYHQTGLPYLIDNGSLTVDTNVTLRIPAGTVIKMGLYESFFINEYGQLDLQGTSGNPVYFTSYKDDTLGGDTNGDGVASTPAAGNWGYIQIDQNDGVDLHHCVIRYGGYSGSNHGAVYVYESSPTIRDSTIEYCEYGIEVFGDSNTSASSFAPSRPAVTNNTVQNCTYAPLLQVEYSFPSYSGNTFSGNGRQAVTVYGLLEASSPQVDTWDDYHQTGLPYLIDNGSLTVDTNVTLRIPAGTVIKMGLYESFFINEYGQLDLQGTSGNPVYFTSYKDDTLGGDTNGDGVASTPAAGNWGYIQIDQNDGVDLHHCVIRYGGYSGSNHGAVYVYESSPTIRDNTIEYCEYGIEVFGDSNTSASSFAPSRPAVTNNTVQNCTYAPLLQVEYSFPSYSGNTFSGNGRQAVTVYGLLEASSPQVDTWDDYHQTGLPYLIDNGSLTVDTNVTLRIPAGTVIKMGLYESFFINEYGQLDLQGTSGNPVYFTSYKDDTLGGDTYGDGVASTPAAGNWGYIQIDQNDGVDLHHCVIRYGGYSGSNHGAVYVYQCSPRIKFNTIEYNRYGIETYGSSSLWANALIEHNIIRYNQYGIYVRNYSNPTITYNDIYANSGYGVNNAGGNLILAVYNWWGDESGPVHANNPGGSGDSVTDDVNYSIWEGQTPDSSTVYGSDNHCGRSADPVNTATGNFIYEKTDIYIKGIGLNLAFSRSYNSQSGLNGPLGFGWSHKFNTTVLVAGDGVASITYGDGHVQQFLPDGEGGFLSPPDTFEEFSDNGDGTFSLITNDFLEYRLNAATGKLVSITDLNGNSLSFAFDGNGDLDSITDTMGRVVDVTNDANHRITQLTDPIGRIIAYEYDANGDLIKATDARGFFEEYTYDGQHQILTVKDKRGNTKVSLTYNLDRVVTSQRDVYANPTSYVYDPANRMTNITDPYGNIFYHYYDTGYRLTKEVDPLGNFAEYTYDTKGNRLSVKDKLGNTTTYAYDDRGNVVAKTDPLGNHILAEYNDLNLPTKKTDQAGNQTTLTYDAQGNLLNITDALGNSTAYTYNTKGQKLTITDALTHVTIYLYDTTGYLEKVTNAETEETTYTYDGVGRLLTVTDPLSHVTTYNYDPNDNLLTVKNHLNEVVTTTYDANDNVLTVANHLTETITNTYDLKNRLVQVTDPLTNPTTFVYDKLDRKIKEIDALSKETDFEYDLLGNLTKIIDPNGHETTYEYDANGRRTKMIDASGNETLYTYDTLGRMVEVTDANNGGTTAEYDAHGNLILVIDPLTNETAYEYDALNRIIKEIDALANETLYTYDAAGNLLTREDGNGQVVTYTYDNVNRLTQVSYSGGDVITYTYDMAGNRLTMTDSVGITSYSYDALNRLVQVTDPYGKIVGYTYDAAGRRDSLTYPGSLTVDYGYNAAGRLTSVNDWLGTVTQFTYNAIGQMTDQVNGNGSTVTRTFDDSGRLSSLFNKRSDNSVITSHVFTLDNVGNRTQALGETPLLPTIPTASLTYTHNIGNQVTADGIRTYTYDGNGNRSSSADGVTTTTYAYNAMDRLNEVNGTIMDTYAYNGNGDLLSAVRDGTETRYVLDPASGMTNILAETDNVGNVLRYYIHSNGLLYSIEASDNSIHYYHYDVLGSTLALTDEDEVITDSYAYSPYGANAGAQGSAPNPFRYVGQYGVMEEGNGLLFMRARFYDPVTKRFMGNDPVKGIIEESMTLNPHSYALCSPSMYNDPSGKIVITASVIGAIVLKAAITYALNKFVVKPYVLPKVIEGAQSLPGSHAKRHGIDPGEYDKELSETAFDVTFALSSLAISAANSYHATAGPYNDKITAARNIHAVQPSHASAGRIGGLTTAKLNALRSSSEQWAFEEISQSITEEMIFKPVFNSGKI